MIIFLRKAASVERSGFFLRISTLRPVYSRINIDIKSKYLYNILINDILFLGVLYI